MKNRVVALLGSSLLVLGTAAVAIAVQDQKLSPEQQKQMEMFMQAGTPGPEHAELAKGAGTWDMAVKMWWDANTPPTESKGVMTAAMVLGGRYLRGDVVGEPMGDQRFEGTVCVAFDNVTKTWQSTWIDNMSTSISVMTAPGGGDGKVRTWKGTMSDPMAGKAVAVREVQTHMSPDSWKSETFAPGKDGKEYKSMEIVYTRRKGG